MLQLAIDTALEAGTFLKKNVGKIRQIEYKGGEKTNLVTEIDKKSEEIIFARIREKHPDHDFLGEESGAADVQSEYRWIIDPLDGTINYTHGLPIYCVSIGLEYKGEIIVGVVYDPSMDELFYAEKGKGAWMNKSRLRVSNTNELMSSLLVTGFPYSINKQPEPTLTHFRNFIIHSQAVRRLGSAAIDLAYVACGRFDGFWEGTLNAWDMAAGILLVSEAGGVCTDYLGKPLNIYNQRVLATNGVIHQPMLDVLKSGMEG